MEKLAETILDLKWKDMDDFAVAIFDKLVDDSGYDARDIAVAIHQWADENWK